MTDETIDSKFVPLQSLVLGTTPYAYIDDARFTAFSPSSKASFPSISAASQASIQPAIGLDMLPVSAPQVTQKGTGDSNSASESSEGVFPQASHLAEAVPRSPESAAKRAVVKNRLPNTTLQVDLRTLNLHLALRTFEVIACAEAMWEWVLEFQASPPKIYASWDTGDPVEKTIAELSRSEFDALLTQFNL